MAWRVDLFSAAPADTAALRLERRLAMVSDDASLGVELLMSQAGLEGMLVAPCNAFRESLSIVRTKFSIKRRKKCWHTERLITCVEQ